MAFDQEQLDAITGLAKKALTEFVKSDDFAGAMKEATNSAASEAATTIVNKAITSKLKSFGNSLESRMAELIKEAVPPKQDDDDPPVVDPNAAGDPDAAMRKSKAFRELTKSHDALAAQVEKGNSEREAIESTAFQKERDADLKALASDLNAVEPEVIVDALRARVSRDDSGDLVVVTKDKEGVETVQTTQEHVETYLKARPFLIKSSGGGGAGSGEGQSGGAGGAGGEGIKPGELKDPVKYKEARAAGEIPGVPAASKSS